MEKMKNKRLKLDELKVQSFVTELAPDLAHTAKGGEEADTAIICSIISAVINSIFQNSGNSKWPCRFVCPVSPAPAPPDTGGSDTFSA